jgi:hypothetical protein
VNEAQPEIKRKKEIESAEVRAAVRALTFALIGDGAAL